MSTEPQLGQGLRVPKLEDTSPSQPPTVKVSFNYRDFLHLPPEENVVVVQASGERDYSHPDVLNYNTSAYMKNIRFGKAPLIQCNGQFNLHLSTFARSEITV